MEAEGNGLELTPYLTTIFNCSSSDPLRMNTTDQIKRLLPTDKETEVELGAQFLKILMSNTFKYMGYDKRWTIRFVDVLKAAKMLGFTVPASMHDPLLNWSSMYGDHQLTLFEICHLYSDESERCSEFLSPNEMRRMVRDFITRRIDFGEPSDVSDTHYEVDDADRKFVIEYDEKGLVLLLKECESLLDKAEDESRIFVQPFFRLSVKDFAEAFHFVTNNELRNDIYSAATRSAMNLIQQLMEVVIFGNLGLNVVRDGVSPCDSPSLLTLELDGIKFESQLYSPSDVFYTEFIADSNDDDDDDDDDDYDYDYDYDYDDDDDDDDDDEWVPNVTDGEDDNDDDDDSFADEVNITIVDLLRST